MTDNFIVYPNSYAWMKQLWNGYEMRRAILIWMWLISMNMRERWWNSS